MQNETRQQRRARERDEAKFRKQMNRNITKPSKYQDMTYSEWMIKINKPNAKKKAQHDTTLGAAMLIFNFVHEQTHELKISLTEEETARAAYFVANQLDCMFPGVAGINEGGDMKKGMAQFRDSLRDFIAIGMPTDAKGDIDLTAETPEVKICVAVLEKLVAGYKTYKDTGKIAL